jgi:protein-tyrosine kinase
MSSSPRRSHLVERAADAARAAMAADASLARVPRPPLAPVEAIPAAVETVAPRPPLAPAEAITSAVETVAPRPPLSPAEAITSAVETVAPRPPLVPAEAITAAIETVVPRPPLAPTDAIPAAVETVRPAPHSQAAGRDAPASITRALLRRAGLVGEAGPAREEIALVREQVLRSVEATPPAEGRQARLVVISSTRSCEGKSFAALNLAASIAEGAHRPVILVDTERGAASLTAQLGLRGVPGFAQLHDMGDPGPTRLLRRTEIPGLFVLPHGTAEPSGTKGSAMAAALLHLAGRLPDHLILVDTPACLESSIAGLLAAAAGQIALVVEAERTKRAEVEAALDILDACPTLQLLLNRAALRVSDRFEGRAPRAGDAAVDAQQA